MSNGNDSSITRFLHDLEDGRPGAGDALLGVVCGELLRTLEREWRSGRARLRKDLSNHGAPSP